MTTQSIIASAGALLLAGALSAQTQLTHRYSFTGNANDSVGTAHGTLHGSADLSSGTAVYLDGSAGTYVELPGGLISGYSTVTIEAWASMSANGAWTRLFDFGGTDASGNGFNYIFFTPHSGTPDTRVAVSDADPGYNHEQLTTVSGMLDDGSEYHVAVVLDPLRSWCGLYINGVLSGTSEDATIPLTAIDAAHCYLGKSLYDVDPYMIGSINEFRIHQNALSSAALAASYAGGPEALAYDPGTVTALSMSLPAQIRQNSLAVPELNATYTGVGEIVLGVEDVTLSSSKPAVVEVRASGVLFGKGVGTATITAAVGDKTATATMVVQPAPAVLVNRYSFSEAAGAAEVVDSVSGANGTAYAAVVGTNAVVFGNGQATFPQAATYRLGAYIDLPDGLISSKTNITFEVWATWNGPAGTMWARIFDFGSGGKGDSPFNSGNGNGSFFLTPLGGANVVRFDAAPTGFSNEQVLDGSASLAVGKEAHIVCIYAPEYRLSQLWVNGKLVSSRAAPFALASLTDNNNWLGLSNWNDPAFYGSLNEFRIYEGVLTELQIALDRQAGPDTLPPDPGLFKSLTLNAPSLLIGNQVAAQAALLATYENIANVDVSSLSSAKFSSSDTSIFTVGTGGLLRPVKVGSADLIASYQGLSLTSSVAVLAPTSLTVAVTSPLPAGGPYINAQLIAGFAGTNANVAAFAGVTFSSSNPQVATVGAAGAILPLRVGTTTLSASYSGLQASAPVEVALPPGYQAANLIHRYSFSEAAATVLVKDSVGTADGTLVNPSPGVADFTGAGRLKLQGGAYTVSAGYVNLPNGLVSWLTNLTIEGWINWGGPSGSSWQRIFDFGSNAAEEEDTYGNPGRGYMFLTPRSSANTFRFAIKQGELAELPVLDVAALPEGQDVHFAVVYDAAAGAVRLYRNGVRVQIGPVTYPLSVIEDRNVYLGRSQWTDPYFAGQYDEFRIYAGTLLDDEVAASYAAGPDQLPSPAVSLSVSQSAGNVVIAWPASATGYGLETTPVVGPGAAWTPVTATPTTEGGLLKVSVTPSAQAAFYRLKR